MVVLGDRGAVATAEEPQRRGCLTVARKEVQKKQSLAFIIINYFIKTIQRQIKKE